MARNFTITTPTDTVRVGAGGRGEMVFTVTNTGGVPDRGMARIVPLGGTHADWLGLAGESEREFAPGAVHQFTVTSHVPPGTAASRYTYRLDIVSARKSGEDYVEGPVVGFEVPATAAPKKSRWWIWAAAAAVVLVIAVVVILAMRNGGGVVVPNVATGDKDAVTAIRELQAANLTAGLAFIVDAEGTPGTVTMQKPAAGDEVPEKTTVTLDVVVREPTAFTLPPEESASLSDATAIELKKLFDPAPAPPPVETVAVPPVRNKQVVQAMLELQEKGLLANLLHITSSAHAANLVLNQDPQANTQVARGTKVTLVVAQPPRRWTPIDVRGQTKHELSPAMRKAIQEFNTKNPPGQ